VFNDQHGLIPDRLSDTSTLSQPLLFFDGNQRNCLSGAHLNFYVGPRLTLKHPYMRSLIGNLPNLRLLQIIMSVNE